MRSSTLSILIIVIGMILPATLFTQDEGSLRRLYNSIEKLLSQKEYDEAIPLLEDLLRANPHNANYNFKMAYAILRGTSQLNSIPYLEKAIANVTLNYKSRYMQDGAPIDAIWYYALQRFYGYEYDIAKQYFEQYIALIPSTHTNYAYCKEYISDCVSGPQYMKNPSRVKHLSFCEATGLPQHFHSALFSPDESIFIFTAESGFNTSNYKYEYKALNDDIYYIYHRNGVWSNPMPLSSNINTPKREACIGIHSNGKQLLIYREDLDGGNIYYSDLLDSNVWSIPKKFPEPINSTYNESHATLSTDGKTIFFTSDRPGGFGGLDIYMSRLQSDGSWGAAINLGPEVNTAYFEESPHVQINSNLLYFSSNRPGGMGDFDVYRCELRDDGTAFNVKNLGYPINTPRSDMFFKTSYDGGKAYYSSHCKSTNGEYDFMMVEFFDYELYPNLLVKGVVVTKENDTLRNLPITLFNMTMRDITDSTKLDKKTGFYSFNLHSKNNYFASIEYDGEVYFSKPFQFTKYFTDYSFSNVIELDPIIICDSLFKQSVGAFKVFKQSVLNSDNNFENQQAEPVFGYLEKQPLQSVSRMQSSIGIKPYELHAKAQEKEVETPKELLQTLEEKPKEEEQIIQIVEKPDVIEQPIVQQPVVQKPLVRLKKKTQVISADSLLNQGVAGLQGGDYAVSIESIQKAYIMFDTAEDVSKQLLCLDFMTEAYRKTGNIHDALESQKTSLQIIKNNFDDAAVSRKQKEIARIYSELWYQDEAMQLLQQSLVIDEKSKNTERIAETYFKMVDVYLQHNQQEKAIELLQKNLQQPLTAKQQAESYNKMGISYHQIQQFQKAIDNYMLAIQIASKNEDKESLAKYQNNIANAYYDIQKLSEAMIHYKISFGLHQELKSDEGMAIALYNMANVYRATNQYNFAIDNYMQSIALSARISNNDILAKNYFAMVLIYKMIKNYPLALEYYKKYFSLVSPYSSESAQLYHVRNKYVVSGGDIALLQTQMKKTQELLKFEKNKYDKEIKLLQQKEQFYKIARIALVILFVGILFILILLLLRFRTRRKYYKQLAIHNSEILQKQEEISAQREHLSEMNTLLEKLSIVASKTGNAVIIADATAQFEWVNDAFESMYVATNSLFEMAWNDEERAKISECINLKQSVQYETRRKLRSGTTIWVQSMLTPIVIENSIYKIIGIEANIDTQKYAEEQIRKQRDEIEVQAKIIEKQRDVAIDQKNEIQKQKNAVESSIDDLKLAQKKLIESEKMASLGNLVAGISHEINTPVGISIAATTSLREKTYELTEMFQSKKMKQSDLDSYLNTSQNAVQLIVSNLKRTGDLVKSFKRVSVDEMTDTMREIVVHEYLNEVFTSLDAKLKEKQIQLSIDCPSEISLYTYPGAFVQIVSHLVSNAVLHAFKDASEGQIQVRCREIDNRFYFVFEDNGVGMTTEVVQKVFNPFFTTNMQTGTGLGMNIVYNVVTQKLHGDIVCESELGKGTRFTIDFPIVKQTV